MKRRTLTLPCEKLTEVQKSAQHTEHGTSIRELIGQDGMRVIGRAYDKGLIREPKKGRRNA